VKEKKSRFLLLKTEIDFLKPRCNPTPWQFWWVLSV